MAKKSKQVLRKISKRLGMIKKDNELKKMVTMKQESGYSKKDKLELELGRINSNIVNIRADLQGIFKGNIVIENKLNDLLIQKENIENGIK